MDNNAMLGKVVKDLTAMPEDRLATVLNLTGRLASVTGVTIGKVVAKLVTVPDEHQGLVFDLAEKLTGPNQELWREQLKKFLRKEPVDWKREAILELVGTVTVSTSNEEFVVADHFKVDTSDKAAVKISYIGDDFKALFFGKVEKRSSSKSTLRAYHLLKGAHDKDIIAELGDESEVGVSLSEVFALIKKQGRGQGGTLLTGINEWNVFYVRLDNGELGAVNVLWTRSGWYVRARSLGFPYEWRAGNQIFSRNSLEP